MFGSPSKQPPHPVEVSLAVATEIGTEYNSLKAPGNCPTGIYLTPSPESISKWHGVFFVHQGPYGGSVLRFTILFSNNFPQVGPTIRFDSDVFHPMVDPKTKMWHALGSLSQWQPRVHHIPHLLHAVKKSFKTDALASIKEDEAINKQVWSLYRYSHQTFLSMTAQRALKSTARSVLYPDTSAADPPQNLGRNSPSTPPRHRRTLSVATEPGEMGCIEFSQLEPEESEKAWRDLVRSVS